jgi:hypothetical protein
MTYQQTQQLWQSCIKSRNGGGGFWTGNELRAAMHTLVSPTEMLMMYTPAPNSRSIDFPPNMYYYILNTKIYSIPRSAHQNRKKDQFENKYHGISENITNYCA